MTDIDIHDSERYHFPDVCPGASNADGLEELGIKFPVTDRDGRVEIDTRLAFGQLPEDVDSGHGKREATILLNPTYEQAELTQSEIRAIERMYYRTNESIIEHVLNEYNDHLHQMAIDVLETLEPGEFFPVADVTIIGKRGDEWYCADFTVDVYAELADTVELGTEYFEA